MSFIKDVISSSLIRSSGVYTASFFVTSAIPFVLLPVLTRYLTPYDYGVCTMFGVLVAFTSTFTGLNGHGAIGRQYFEGQEINFSQYVANCLYILLISSALAGIALWAFSNYISEYTEFPSLWLWSVWIVSISQFLTFIALTIWQVQVKPVRYSVFQILLSLSNISLSILLVVALSMKWQGRILAQVIATSLFALIAFICIDKSIKLKWKFNKAYVSNALKFGIPLIPHTIGAIIISMTDRMLITNMVSISDMGIYVVGAQIGSVIGLLEGAFNQAWVPWLFSQLKKNDPLIKFNIIKITYVYFVIIIVAALVLSWIAPWFISIIVGEKFRDASRYVIWIALGWAFDGMYKMVTNYIFYEQKTHLLAFITLLTGVANIVMCYFLIKYNGTIGAAQATMFSFLFSFILTWLLSMKVYKMPWNLKLPAHASC